jgi:biopolymer transport protein ExbD
MQISQRLAERSAKRHRNDPYCRIDLFGFVSLFLALLFVYQPTLPHNGRRFPLVTLPESHHAARTLGADREDALTVSVDREGHFFFETNRLYVENLASIFRENLTEYVERRVFIRSDRRARYSDVILVLNAASRAGIENITFITSESPSAPPR